MLFTWGKKGDLAVKLDKIAVLALGLLLGLGGCFARYPAPLETEPHALIKVKFEYVDMNVVGKSITAGVSLVQNNKTYYLMSDNGIEHVQVGMGRQVPLKMQSFRLLPVEITELKAYLTHTVYGYNSEIHYSCIGKFKFTPEAHKVYLLDYKTHDPSDTCMLTLYEQIPQKNGEFKLKKVGEPIIEKNGK